MYTALARDMVVAVEDLTPDEGDVRVSVPVTLSERQGFHQHRQGLGVWGWGHKRLALLASTASCAVPTFFFSICPIQVRMALLRELEAGVRAALPEYPHLQGKTSLTALLHARSAAWLPLAPHAV